MWYWPIFTSKIPKISKVVILICWWGRKSGMPILCRYFLKPFVSVTSGQSPTVSLLFPAFAVVSFRYRRRDVLGIIISVPWRHHTCLQIFNAFFFRLLLTCCFTATDGHQSSSVQNFFRVRGQLALSITAPALRDGVFAPVMELHLCTENAGNSRIYILQRSSAQ